MVPTDELHHHSDGHSHPHHHGHAPASPHPPQAAPWSILRMPAVTRLAAALVLSAGLWAIVLLSMR